MASRAARERKLLVSLPKEVAAWLEQQASESWTSTPRHVRQLMIDYYRAVHGLQVPGIASAGSPSASPPRAARAPDAGSRGVAATRSGFKGVYPYGRRWAAVVYEETKRRRLGVYDTPEDAARTYDAYLVARSGGDPRMAVNFPHELDQIQNANAPYIDKLAAGNIIDDMEWQRWQQSTKNGAVTEAGPMLVLPPSASKIDAKTPLVPERPARSLARRDPAPPPVVQLDPIPAEPDDDVH